MLNNAGQYLSARSPGAQKIVISPCSRCSSSSPSVSCGHRCMEMYRSKKGSLGAVEAPAEGNDCRIAASPWTFASGWSTGSMSLRVLLDG